MIMGQFTQTSMSSDINLIRMAERPTKSRLLSPCNPQWAFGKDKIGAYFIAQMDSTKIWTNPMQGSKDNLPVIGDRLTESHTLTQHLWVGVIF